MKKEQKLHIEFQQRFSVDDHMNRFFKHKYKPGDLRKHLKSELSGIETLTLHKQVSHSRDLMSKNSSNPNLVINEKFNLPKISISNPNVDLKHINETS